jgi:CheY-like chemotaxis protein
VLIVEDSPDAATSLRELIEMWGHEVRWAATGAAAMAAAQEFRPQIVLLDLGLPDLSGDEVLRRIRAGGDLARTVFVALTGRSGADIERQARDAGFARHLVKPPDLELLQRLLEEL